MNGRAPLGRGERTKKQTSVDLRSGPQWCACISATDPPPSRSQRLGFFLQYAVGVCAEQRCSGQMAIYWVRSHSCKSMNHAALGVGYMTSLPAAVSGRYSFLRSPPNFVFRIRPVATKKGSLAPNIECRLSGLEFKSLSPGSAGIFGCGRVQFEP